MQTIVLGGFEEFQGFVVGALARKEDALVVNGLRGDADWFCNAVCDAEAGLFDFDGTLHGGKPGTPQTGNQWKDVAKLMTPEDQAGDREEAAWYFARKDGEPTPEEITRFGFNSIRRMRSSGISEDDYVRLARASPPRDGAVTLLRSFARRHAWERCAIVSFGMERYIREWSEAHGVDEGLIIAATKVRFTGRLREQDNGIIARTSTVSHADPLTFVGTHNKGHVAHAIVESFEVPMERVLVVGDSPTDMHMMSAGNLAVLVVPHGDPDPQRVAFRLRGLAEMWPRVAAVLVSDSLEALAEMRLPRA